MQSMIKQPVLHPVQTSDQRLINLIQEKRSVNPYAEDTLEMIRLCENLNRYNKGIPTQKLIMILDQWGGKINQRTFNTLLNKLQDYPCILQLYQQSPFKDQYTHSILIKKAGQFGYFADAQTAFKETKTKGRTSAFIYNAYIDAAGRCGKMAEAITAFDEAVCKELANSTIYNTFIYVAGENGHIDMARKIFEIVTDKKLATSDTYNKFINILDSTHNCNFL